jgi:hypothetical protein
VTPLPLLRDCLVLFLPGTAAVPWFATRTHPASGSSRRAVGFLPRAARSHGSLARATGWHGYLVRTANQNGPLARTSGWYGHFLLFELRTGIIPSLGFTNSMVLSLVLRAGMVTSSCLNCELASFLRLGLPVAWFSRSKPESRSTHSKWSNINLRPNAHHKMLVVFTPALARPADHGRRILRAVHTNKGPITHRTKRFGPVRLLLRPIQLAVRDHSVSIVCRYVGNRFTSHRPSVEA